MSAGGSCGRREGESEMELTTIFCVTATLKKVTFHMSELTRGASYQRGGVEGVYCSAAGRARYSYTALYSAV